LQCVLLELALSFFADFAFKVGVWGGEYAGVTGIYFRPRIIDTRAEDFRCGQVNRHFPPLN